MYKNKIVYFLFLSLFVSFNFSQWKNLSSQIVATDLTLNNNKLWVATEGGAYCFSPEDSTFEQFTLTDGLSNQNLSAITSNNLNQIWIGSKSGTIDVYNTVSKEFSSLLDLSKAEATSKSIISFSFSGDSVLALSNIGLSIINASSISFNDTYQNFGSLPAGVVLKDTKKINGLLYVCSAMGLAVQKPGAANLFLPSAWDVFLSGTDCKKVLKYNNQILLISNNRIIRLVNGVAENFLFNNGTENLLDMCSDGNNLYILSSIAVYKYDGTNLSSIYNISENTPSRLSANNDIVYIAGNSGVTIINQNNASLICPNSPLSNSFVDLATDSEGNLWCASGRDISGKGVFKWDGKIWTNYSTKNVPEFKSNAFHKVNISQDNTVFFSNWGQGFTQLKDGNFTTYDYHNTNPKLIGAPENNEFVVIEDVVKDNSNNIWLLNEEPGNQSPVSVLTSSGVWHHFRVKSPLTANDIAVKELVIDRNGTKWFICRRDNNGLMFFNDKGTLSDLQDDKWGLLTTYAGLNSLDLSCLILDQKGELWIGSSKGIDIIRDPSKLDKSILITIPFELRWLDNIAITSIAVDPLNQKWIGTTKGIFHYSEDGSVLIANYTSANSPLPSDEIISIAVDGKSGIVYFGTDAGISALQTTSVSPKENFGQIGIYPNPFIIDGSNKKITIDGLIENSSIKIFNISGSLINEMESPGGAVALWDGKDMDGNYVPSGIYIISAYNKDGSGDIGISKLAVIKK